MSIKKIVTFLVPCKNCSNTITVSSVDELKKSGWTFNQATYSNKIEFDSLSNILCPKCSKLDHDLKYTSEDIHDRISAGYYDDFPEKFEPDVLIDLDINDHPNRHKLYLIAWEMGHGSGYSEMYNIAHKLSILLKP